MDSYVRACIEEIRIARVGEETPLATSVFVGGGTPSRLSPELIEALVRAVPSVPGVEVTVECNPEDASSATFDRWRTAGVTRVSLGLQSTDPRVLAGLGRRHGPASAEPVLAQAWAAGFDSVSVDLIFGGPGETDDSWARTLIAVVGSPYAPTHVSAYALTVEPGTPLGADEERHPDDDEQARRYEIAEEILSGAGYRWYEVSSWAKPGYECRHNQLYWTQGDYRGIGCAAHSHRAGRRWWNVRTPDRYVRLIESGDSVVAGEEVLDPGRRAFEALAMGLRTARGVPHSALPDDLDLTGIFERSGDRAVLTVR
ncbi:MAG TPA: coproporphyrinogen-III oxidase family protein, partial [Acidimicrobiales bacterium]|nr:coproporphyrinogen-III oxidase family protein [Acidimicrobiales bacterium]